MGYLHLLPRLIAWVAAHTLDPAWWPAFYNGVSFLVWLAVIARTFSPRLALPGKPWLALAFFIGPQTGEILFNITNLQWLTALLLVEQAIVAPPVTWAERVGDLLVKGYMLPAPPDYHWAQQCEPIRRGVPANIPTLPEGWTLEYRGRLAPAKQRP